MILQKNAFLIERILLLLIFFIPWFAIDLLRYEIYIKEISVIFAFLYIFIKSLLDKNKLSLDLSGLFYFWFLFVCIFYYFVEASRHISYVDLSFLTHVLISTILNFVIYVTFVNIKINRINLQIFTYILLLIYLLVGAYFIYYSMEVHSLSKNLEGGYHTYQLKSQRAGTFHYYLGGSNGRSWFFLVLTSFFVGYFVSKKKYFSALMCISFSLIASYFMSSRGAILFGIILFILIFFRLLKMRGLLLLKMRVLLTIILFSVLILLLFYSNNSLDFSIHYSLINKGFQLSTRDYLVFESLHLSTSDYFLGRGFHYTQLHKSDLSNLGYDYISVNGPQNVFLSILIEVGILGLVLFSSFWFFLYRNLTNSLKFIDDGIEKYYLSGIKYLVVWIMFSFIFSHYTEKVILYYPIYMMLIGTAVSVTLYKKKKIIM